MKKLSIIISNRNDTTMLSVTVRSCIEELRPLGLKNCEIVIVDNSDENVYKLLPSYIPIGYIQEGIVKVYRQLSPCLFSARETAARKSEGKYISCVDSHMIIGRNMFKHLHDFMEDREWLGDKTIGFAHAPITWAHQHERSAKHDRDMSVCELGNWGTKRKKHTLISWKGMPWICKRDWFINRDNGIGGYGALSANSLSWGGGDMHIGIKPWLLGYKNWAVPCFPGIHIGPFPKVDTKENKNITIVGRDKYRTYSTSGNGPPCLGFLVSCYVLGGEHMMERNRDAINNRFGNLIDIDKNWELAKNLGKDEKAWLDSVKVTTFEKLLSEKPWK